MQIAASSQEQLAGVNQVSLAMENITQATAQSAAGIRQTEVATRKLAELGSQLQDLVEHYKVDTDADQNDPRRAMPHPMSRLAVAR
jgi:methyl-accepting chemotaxis protein